MGAQSRNRLIGADQHDFVPGAEFVVGAGADLDLPVAIHGDHLHPETVGELELVEPADDAAADEPAQAAQDGGSTGGDELRQ